MAMTKPKDAAAESGSRDGATEERILAAAHAVFVRKGAFGARMQEIADEAGVNRALLHYYFQDREGLARAVFRRAMEEMFPASLRVWTSEAPFEENLRESVRLYFAHVERNPYLPGFILTEMHVNPAGFREMLESMPHAPMEAARVQFEAAMAAGIIRRVPVEQVLVSVHSLIVYPFAARPLTEALLSRRDISFEAFVRERQEFVADFILRALKP
jgi:TetR/AcrR family transcriptional regulator